jgi:hypothetical protein
MEKAMTKPKAADRFELFTCPDCPHMHFEFFDGNGRSLCTASLSREQLLEAAAMLAPVQ